MPRKPRAPRRTPPPPKAPLAFRPLSWREYYAHKPMRYMTWIYRELGRLGMDPDDLAPVHEQPLTELVSWWEDWPNRAYAELSDPLKWDFNTLSERWKTKRDAKPRIELWAEVTKKGNLTVRWYPTGFHDVAPAWSNSEGWSSGNMIAQRQWPQPPDFRFFHGDEAASWSGRASNELMFLRGVGHLHFQTWRGDTYTHDVVTGLVLGAVRASYGAMIHALKESFEVTRRTDFEFDLETLPADPKDAWAAVGSPPNRIVGWRLVDLPPAAGWSRNELAGREPGEVVPFVTRRRGEEGDPKA